MKRFHTTTYLTSDSRIPPIDADLKPRKERSKLACNECRRKKLKCDNSHPCATCRARSLPCTVSSASRPPGRPRNGETDLSRQSFLRDNPPEMSQLGQSAVMMAQDAFEPQHTSNSGTHLDTSPSNPVLLVNSISAADFDLPQDQGNNDMLNGPNPITIDTMEVAFPNESNIMDESWGYPQFLEGFDWQLPTLVSFVVLL